MTYEWSSPPKMSQINPPPPLNVPYDPPPTVPDDPCVSLSWHPVQGSQALQAGDRPQLDCSARGFAMRNEFSKWSSSLFHEMTPIERSTAEPFFGRRRDTNATLGVKLATQWSFDPPPPPKKERKKRTTPNQQPCSMVPIHCIPSDLLAKFLFKNSTTKAFSN